MKLIPKEKTLHGLFRIGIFLKGLDGILEIAGGLLLLFVSRAAMNQVVRILTQHELQEDPDDWFANLVRQAVAHISVNTKIFASLYLVGHGFIKLLLVVGLWQNKLWSYPTALAFLLGFIGYQIYRINLSFSWGLMFLTAFDFVVALLVWHEYGWLKQHRPAGS